MCSSGDPTWGAIWHRRRRTRYAWLRRWMLRWFWGTGCRPLPVHGLRMSDIILARQARVALGDHIAQALGAQTVVVALGERPGLSAADSLGVYITHRPCIGTQDSARNCISNIRDAGISVTDAALQTERLVLAMRDSGLSGVALSQSLAEGAVTNRAE